VLGQEVKAFEKEVAAYLGARECVSVANGTEALELALRVFQIGPGNEVCTVANAGMYSTTAILNAGATPVFVDVEADTLTMSPNDLAARITERTKAVIATHLYGCMADLDGILAVARARGLSVIEDCAQAHGAKRQDRMAGTWGDIGCFSFYPTKNLGALGDGGALCTDDQGVAERLRALRQYGWSSRYHSTFRGGRNSRLDELQAAFLRVKLPMLDRWNQRRQQIARLYNQAFRDTRLILSKLDDDSNVVHLYVVRLPQRDQFRQLLTEAVVGSDVHYPVPDYSQDSVREQLGGHEPLPETERACCQVVTLPCFPELADSEVDQVVSAVRAVLKRLPA
jgi:dTDP-4-amino-4,6-dideoxygalactose transaminase